MTETPDNIKVLLKLLKKDEKSLGEYCIGHAVSALKEDGYKDAKLWTTTVLSSYIDDLNSMESMDELGNVLSQVGGVESDVLEAIYDVYMQLYNTLGNTNPDDLKDTILHAVSAVLDEEGRKKYEKIYG